MVMQATRDSESAQAVMTLAEMADFLKVGHKTLMRMAQDGEIPAAKVGGQWRFLREVIEDWLERRMQGVPKEELYQLVETAPAIVPVSRLIPRELILLDVRPGSKETVLAQLLEPLQAEGLLNDPGPILEKLILRENMMSTAIAPGVAFPHPRDPQVWDLARPYVALGLCRDGTDFGALDHGKTHLFFLVCSGKEVTHLRLMAKMALLAREKSAMQQIRQAGTVDEVVCALMEVDTKLVQHI